MENGKPHGRLRSWKQASAILEGTASLQFFGLVQVKEHPDSECHKQAVDFFKVMDNATDIDKSEKILQMSKGSHLASSPSLNFSVF